MERRWFEEPSEGQAGGRADSDTEREGSKVWALAGRKVSFSLAMNDRSSEVAGSLFREFNAAALWRVQTRLDFCQNF